MRGRIVAAAVSAPLLATLTAGGEWRPPPVASTRRAFEVAYPRSTASGAALDLEALSARLGIDLAPKDERRDHPDPESAGAYQAVAQAVRQYVESELASPEERIAAPSDPVARFLSEHEATIDAIRAIAAGRREVAWDLDVSAGLDAPIPNLLGQIRLHLVLAARALEEARRPDPEAALVTVEGMWRLSESLASRPDLLSQMVVLNEARLAVGVVRKVDAPALDWLDRLRGRGFFEAFLAAFQNDSWPFARDPDLTQTVEGMARINRRFVEGLAARDPCAWTQEGLAQSWKVAVSGEPGEIEILASIASENSLDTLVRWHRFLVDAELTALVVEARGEKAASRDGAWPARLMNLGSFVCPGGSWSYRKALSGGVAVAFEGDAPEVGRGLVLPLVFRSAAAPTPTATVRPAVLTPTATANTLPPR